MEILHTAENPIGCFHIKSSVRRAPEMGVPASAAKEHIVKASPRRMLTTSRPTAERDEGWRLTQFLRHG